MIMQPKTYFAVTGTVFAILSILFLFLGINRYNVIIDFFVIQFWVSLILFVLFGFISFEGFRHGMQKDKLKSKK